MNQIKESRIESLIQRGHHITFTEEYNCKLRRLFPWHPFVNTKRVLTEFGCIWVVVDAGKDVDLHSHDEEETFVVISGSAELEVDGETTTLNFGDVAYLPRFAKHCLRNRSEHPFVMIDIYWDMNGKSDSSL